ncbi:AsmA family protein [Chitinimonas lacunae]|uniref:AsmA family protein n=1 Tax=Chitinimonas lacunae TaxID=1963018 RepID=A0ABV8MUA1_9NEIS
MHLRQLSPRRRRWLFSAVAVLLAVIVLPLLDIAPLKERIAADASESLGRRLEVGALRLALLPRPSITLEDVTLAQPGGTEFAKFESARFSLGWGGLLQGRAEFVDGRVEGLKLKVLQYEDGSLSCDDLLQRKPRRGRVEWHLNRVQLVDAGLDWQDRFGERMRLDGIELHAVDPEAEGGVMTVQGQLAAADWRGALKIESGLRFDREKLTAQLSQFRLGLRVETPEWREGVFALQGDFHAAALPWRASASRVSANASVKRGESLWRAGFKTPQLQFGENGFGTGQLDADFLIKGSRTELSGTLGVARLSAVTHRGTLAADSADLKLKLMDPVQSVSLDVKSPLRLDGWQRVELSQLALTGAYRHRSLPRGAIQLALGGRARVDLQRERLDWETSGSLDGAALQAKLSLEDFVSPRYAFGLDLAKLDLTPYLPVASETELVSGAAPLDWSWLYGLNARGDLRLGQLDIGRFKVNELRTHIEAADRRATLEPLEAEVYGGRLKGRLSIDVRKEPKLALRQSLTGMEVEALLGDVLQLDRIAGRGNLQLDLYSRADSVESIRRHLGGAIEVSLTRGTLSGIDIGDTLRSLRANLAQLTGVPLPADSGRRTRFSELQARFEVREGVANGRHLAVQAPFIQMGGEGKVDLIQGEVDYDLKARVVGGSGIPELDALKGVIVPISIKGALASPAYRVDTSALSAKLGQAVKPTLNSNRKK